MWKRSSPKSLNRASRRILLGCALFLGACAPAGPKFLIQDFHAPPRVAVLPFANETNDIDAPELVRKNFQEMLPVRGYLPIDPKRVDEILQKKFGITEGGQLNSVTPAELGKALEVEGLFYGNVITFQDLPLGFARKRTVKAAMRLVDCKSGQLMWEDQRSWTTPEIYLDQEKAKAAAVRQVAERQIEKMTGTFLKPETRLVIQRMLDHLPPAR